MKIAIIKKPSRNNCIQTVIAVALLIGIVAGFWYGSQMTMNTAILPVLAVTSSSMCLTDGDACDGGNHPFDETLHVGDIILIQGLDPQNLKTNYPNSDIIVFQSPNNPNELIERRIVDATTVNGTLYFFTKGDGTGSPDIWPAIPQTFEFDYRNGVSEDLVVGKVVMRAPWLGNTAVFMHDVFGVDNNYVSLATVAVLIGAFAVVEVAKLMFNREPVVVEHKSVTRKV